MTYYIVKILLTTLLIVLISEIAKRSSFIAAILTSIPLISVLAFIWLYIDTGDVAKISDLAKSIFWLVLPSLVLFISLPLLLSQGINFYISLSVSILLTIICYVMMIAILRHFEVRL